MLETSIPNSYSNGKKIQEKHSTIHELDNDKKEQESTEILDFLKLLKELQEKLVEVKQSVQQVQNKASSGLIKTSNGVSLLDIKNYTLLQYIINLTFLIHLKLDGKSIANHPAITSLIESRVVLEKIKPIEHKLKYQIDKLVRAATITNDDNNNQEIERKKDSRSAMTDPLAFKPNPENLISKDVEDIEDNNEIGGESAGVYKAPKLAPVHFDEDQGKNTRHEKERSRLLVRASKSRLMRDILAEYDDHPEEIDATGGVNEGIGPAEKGSDVRWAERTHYEEENFVRLTVSKKEMRKMRGLGADSVKRIQDEFELYINSTRDGLIEHGKKRKIGRYSEATNAKRFSRSRD
ncbi:11997_t:CDS:2 [Ambispora leptoticha]|uniref:11997_t:CDS:1 n=1 Tax=Ambispora leptoticha TaxID=144679 RepID=A0A9N8VGH3_9GLOM|nr:11997_t:CDS:2 [Ambispora leptoticha]